MLARYPLGGELVTGKGSHCHLSLKYYLGSFLGLSETVIIKALTEFIS